MANLYSICSLGDFNNKYSLGLLNLGRSITGDDLWKQKNKKTILRV